MAVRRTSFGVTISGDDLKDLKAALRRDILGPKGVKVPPGHAQCPGCKEVLPIWTKEQSISGICDPCWDKTLEEEPQPQAKAVATDDDNAYRPF